MTPIGQKGLWGKKFEQFSIQQSIQNKVYKLKGKIQSKNHDTVAWGSVRTDYFIEHISNPQMTLSI